MSRVFPVATCRFADHGKKFSQCSSDRFCSNDSGKEVDDTGLMGDLYKYNTCINSDGFLISL